jgi:hypothetical protein
VAAAAHARQTEELKCPPAKRNAWMRKIGNQAPEKLYMRVSVARLRFTAKKGVSSGRFFGSKLQNGGYFAVPRILQYLLEKQA